MCADFYRSLITAISIPDSFSLFRPTPSVSSGRLWTCAFVRTGIFNVLTSFMRTQLDLEEWKDLWDLTANICRHVHYTLSAYLTDSVTVCVILAQLLISITRRNVRSSLAHGSQRNITERKYYPARYRILGRPVRTHENRISTKIVYEKGFAFRIYALTYLSHVL